MSLLGSSKSTTDVMYVELTYIGADGEPVNENGWCERAHSHGGTLTIEWYNPDDPEFYDRDEYGCARVVKLSWETNWIKIEEGEDPPSILDARRGDS